MRYLLSYASYRVFYIGLHIEFIRSQPVQPGQLLVSVCALTNTIKKVSSIKQEVVSEGGNMSSNLSTCAHVQLHATVRSQTYTIPAFDMGVFNNSGQIWGHIEDVL